MYYIVIYFTEECKRKLSTINAHLKKILAGLDISSYFSGGPSRMLFDWHTDALFTRNKTQCK